MMKIGILGGTFDPPHNAHKEIANRALEQFDLEKILFIPSGISWQKNNVSDYKSRYNMTRLLIEGNNNFEISDIENNLNKPSYTIETLKKLNYIKDNTFFILGADAASGITSWNSYKELDKYTKFLIAPRETVSNKHLESTFPFDFQTIEGGYLDISSTNVRKIMKTESNLENFIPYEIIKFINENDLYNL